MDPAPFYTFYMVVLDGGTAPNKRYDNEEPAHREAERLSAKEGRTAYVLTATGRCTPVPPAMNWTAPEPRVVPVP